MSNASSGKFAAHFRRQRFDFCPWKFHEATEGEQREQEEYQSALREELGVRLGRGCYISQEAAIVTEPQAALVMGDKCYVAAEAYITGRVRFGDNCSINPFVTLRDNVSGGDGIRIGAYSSLIANNHGFSRTDIPIHRQPCTSRGIILGDDVWIGSHVTILDGVRVGHHAIVGAGAVVTRDVPDYAIVAGNPARIIRLRKKSSDTETAARMADFSARVSRRLDELLARYLTRDETGSTYFVDRPGAPRRVRPCCDAVEIAAMFDRTPPGIAPAKIIADLRGEQDLSTGLAPEHFAVDRALDPGPAANPEFAARYNTMIVNYALECLGSQIGHPIANASDIAPTRLPKLLAGLDWASRGWTAGSWVDCYASCLCINDRHFQKDTLLAPLLGWLDESCDPATGLWGRWEKEGRWLQAVNGFYRLTRGAYAQTGRPLPHPKAAIDTILSHAADAEYFGDRKGNACNVLDVIHPLWLCLKQTSHRRGEVEGWVRERLPVVLGCWEDGRGFSFDLTRAEPGLQGTEMWLSIVWLMADLLGCADALPYRPRGVHRPEPVRGLSTLAIPAGQHLE